MAKPRSRTLVQEPRLIDRNMEKRNQRKRSLNRSRKYLFCTLNEKHDDNKKTTITIQKKDSLVYKSNVYNTLSP